MALTKYKLGELIYEIDRRNANLEYGMAFVRGISNTKEIMSTKADVDETVLHKFYIILPGEFIYNPRTTRMGEKVGLAYNNTDTPLLFTFNNIAFGIRESAKQTILIKKCHHSNLPTQIFFSLHFYTKEIRILGIERHLDWQN